jgi:hypothetical protein
LKFTAFKLCQSEAEQSGATVVVVVLGEVVVLVVVVVDVVVVRVPMRVFPVQKSKSLRTESKTGVYVLYFPVLSVRLIELFFFATSATPQIKRSKQPVQGAYLSSFG